MTGIITVTQKVLVGGEYFLCALGSFLFLAIYRCTFYTKIIYKIKSI